MQVADVTGYGYIWNVLPLSLLVQSAQLNVLYKNRNTKLRNLPEVESDLAIVDLSFLPAEELVGDVVLLADVLALLLLVTEGVSVSDGVWLPLVGGRLV